MTDVSSLERPSTPAGLTEQDVADFLQANPDFFIRQPELLTRIQVHHPDRGVVSLVDIQLERLRRQVGELEEKIADLIGVASQNSVLFEEFARAQQQLFQSHHIYQAISVLTALAERLHLDVTVRLFDSLDDDIFMPRQAFDEFRRSHLASRTVYLGRLRQQERTLFFDDAPQLGSFLVLPFGQERPMGVLAFASADGGHFQPAMDTLFVEQLAMVLARLIHHWEYTREVIE
ncbi:DUF484 family protein [Photobacterium japonica]|uniref:DUF484 family protein n=1 Tax=Photobacterium japonica TaxID=2910235 RepID=UPI003D111141